MVAFPSGHLGRWGVGWSGGKPCSYFQAEERANYPEQLFLSLSRHLVETNRKALLAAEQTAGPFNIRASASVPQVDPFPPAGRGGRVADAPMGRGEGTPVEARSPLCTQLLCGSFGRGGGLGRSVPSGKVPEEIRRPLLRF